MVSPVAKKAFAKPFLVRYIDFFRSWFSSENVRSFSKLMSVLCY